MQLPDLLKSPETAPAAELPDGNRLALWKFCRRIVVFVLGVSVLAVGVVMIIGPGPAVIVIPLGLAILATEFVWARRLLDSLKCRLVEAQAAATEATLPRWMRFFVPKKNRSE